MKGQRKTKWISYLLAATLIGGTMAGGGSFSTEAAAKIKLSKTKLTLKKGGTAKLTLKKGKKKIAGVKWKSSNKKVATVSSAGKIKAKKAGKSVITAKYKKKTYSCNLTVKAVKNPANNKKKDTTPGSQNGSENQNDPGSQNGSENQNNPGSQTTPGGESETPKEEPVVLSGEITVSEMTVKRANADGSENTIYGKIYAPVESGKFPAIILSHGYNGTNADWVNECTYYAKHGYVAYALDFCGGSVNSKSSGKSTEMTVLTEKADLTAVLDHISGLDNVDKTKVFLMGGSQGGLVTALTAAEQVDRVKGVLLYFPALCVPDDWKKKYNSLDEVPATQNFWGLELGKCFVEDIWEMDVFSVIGAYDKDVLIFHGDKDDIVPLSYSQKAVDEIYPCADLVVFPGEGHGFTPSAGKTAMEKIVEFMDAHK